MTLCSDGHARREGVLGLQRAAEAPELRAEEPDAGAGDRGEAHLAWYWYHSTIFSDVHTFIQVFLMMCIHIRVCL